MGPSYNNSFGGFSSVSVGANDGVVSAGGKQVRNKLVIGLIIVAIIVVLAVAVVTVLLTTRSSSSSFEQDVKDFYNSFGWISLTSQCSRATIELENKNYNSKGYEALIDECRDSSYKVKELMNSLDGKGDQAFIEIFNKIKNGVSEVMIFDEDLEKDLSIYSAWHDYHANIQLINNYSADTEIESAAAPLLNSGNDVLENYGKNWVEKRISLNYAYLNLEVFPNDLDEQSAFDIAEADLLSYVEENKPDVLKMTRIGEVKEYPEFQKNLYELREYIKEKYEE